MIYNSVLKYHNIIVLYIILIHPWDGNPLDVHRLWAFPTVITWLEIASPGGSCGGWMGIHDWNTEAKLETITTSLIVII